MAVIKTTRLLLRPVELGDAPRFAVLCNDIDIARNTSRIPFPYTLQDAENFTASAVSEAANDGERRFAICRDGKIIACAGLMRVSNNASELGYWVGAQYRGQGVASEAAAAIVHHAFDALGVAFVTAGYFLDNPASGRVLEKVGFQPAGGVIKIMSVGRGCEADTVRMRIGYSELISSGV